MANIERDILARGLRERCKAVRSASCGEVVTENDPPYIVSGAVLGQKREVLVQLIDELSKVGMLILHREIVTAYCGIFNKGNAA